MKISIGKTASGHNVAFDLDTLITTRLLIQANSGAGKSWLLRRLMEELFGHVQVIAIDPEGEFATLREKFGFVLVGKGGETPADVRIAGDIAEKLLELRASAVCDLYEMKPSDRHQWVAKFLDSLVNAPKKLWHPVIVVVDEAHMFCPEKGAGESVASEAMIDLCTRGRKRGFCPVWATQRLSKVQKDATTNLLNRLVGGTFEDVDVKRALDLLSVAPEQKKEMSQALRTLEPGFFYAFGRAISKERILFKVGDVQTTHPRPGDIKHAAEPPPAPDKVKQMLPSLADLPKAAEEKARTIDDFKSQIRSLKAELAAAKRVQAPMDPTISQRIVESAVKNALGQRDKQWLVAVRDFQRELDRRTSNAARTLDQFFRAIPFSPPENAAPAVASAVITPRSAAVRVPVTPERPLREVSASANANGDLGTAERKILDELAELEALSIAQPDKSQLALMCGYSNARSGGFSEPLGHLRDVGLIAYPIPGRVQLTDNGRSTAKVVEAPISVDELHERLKQKLGTAESRILDELIRGYPNPLQKADIASSLGYANVRSGGFSEPLGRLRALGLASYPSPGTVQLARWVMLEDAA